MSKSIRDIELSPGIISVLPIFYVGWADTVLSPSEIKLIHKKINSFDFLTSDEKKMIVQWTDPANPPEEAVFKKWVNAMKQSAKSMSMDKRVGLAELGLEMARHSTRSEEGIWQADNTRKSLRDLELALGVHNADSHGLIYNKLGDPPKLQKTKSSFSVDAIRDLLDDDFKEERRKLRIFLRDPIFEYRYTRDKDAHRKQVLEWCAMLADQGYGALSYPEEYGGQNSMSKYAAIFETLAHHDLSLVIKFGVQFGLFGGAIMHLGTKSHHDKYLKKIGTLEIPGCFAMTETGHGSNVRGLETHCNISTRDQEFIIHSPTVQSNKEYIGNALDDDLQQFLLS